METGSSFAAQKAQKEVLREIVVNTLSDLGKTIDSRCIEIFFERLGAQPIAVAKEAEKLALYVGERQKITAKDVEEMVCQSRENAMFELTDALGKKNPETIFSTLDHLLNQGIYPLAILATLRNYVRNHLIYRTLQLTSTPKWHNAMQAKEFQSSYLPELKKTEGNQRHLAGHPYALFLNFSKAAELSPARHKQRLHFILDAEYRLKSSSLPAKLILEELLLSILRGAPLNNQAGQHS